MTTRVLVAVWTLALVAAGGALFLVVTSEHEENPLALALLAPTLGLAFVASGLVAVARRPENRTGVLMTIVGFGWLAGGLAESNDDLLFTVGMVLGALGFAAYAHLVYAFPSGRLDSRLTRAATLLAYVDVIALQLAWMLFEPEPGGADCECPENLLLVTASERAADGIAATQRILALALLGLALVLLARRWRAATPVARRPLTPVLGAIVLSLFLIAALMVAASISEAAADVVYWTLLAGWLAVPLAFLHGLLRSRLARGGAARLLVDIPEDASLEQVQDALRRVLGDSTLRLATWLPDTGGYVDVEGKPFDVPGDTDTCVTTRIEYEGRPVAVLVHDAALRDEPELLEEVVAAARLGLEKDRSLRALRASEERLRALLHASPDLMLRISRDGTYLDAHANDPSLLAAPRERVIGRNARDILPADVAEAGQAAIDRVLATKELETVEYSLDIGGELRLFEGRITPSGDDEVLMVVRDVTERERQQRALVTSEARNRALVDALPDNMYRVRRDGTFVDFEHKRPTVHLDFRGHTVFELMPGEAADRIMRCIDAALEGGGVRTVVYSVETEIGLRQFETRVVRSGDDEAVLIERDVTDQKEQEEALRASERRTRAVLDAIPDLMFRIARDGTYLDFHAHTDHDLYTPVVVGRNVRDRLPADVATPIMEAIERALADGGIQTLDYDLAIRGELRHYEGRIVRSGRDEVLLIVRDVSVQRRQAQVIERERDFIRTVVDSAPALFCVVDTDGRIVRFNAALESLSGYADDEAARGRPFWEVFAAPEAADDVRNAFADVVGGRIGVEHEHVFRSRTGERRTVAWSATTITDVGGERRYLLCGLDITERKRQERELQASRVRIVEAEAAERQRLERNLHDGAQQRLVSLSLALRLAQAKLHADPTAAEELLDRASEELARALEELRELARGIHPAVLTDRGLCAAIQTLAARSPVPVRVEAPEERLPDAVEAAAYYVVSEALTNVVKYAGASAVEVRIARENGKVLVEVADDGVGGANPAAGTGLRGLADRVAALDGQLDVTSAENAGTRIRAEIPFG